MVIGKTKNQVFGEIKSRVSKKLQGWKKNLLSLAGKEVLIKAVVMAIPTCTMSCFKIPKGICKDISKKVANFWWGGDEKQKKMHGVNWNILTEVKGKGGMGFRDLEFFNIALLAKQLWRIITQPDLLVSRIIRKKYWHSEHDWRVETTKNASFVWKSISSARHLLEYGMRRRVGNGNNIRI